jgi:hypothetical protein
MRSPDLITELTATPGRFALIAGAPHDVIVECERLLEVSCCHVGALLADRGSPPSDTEVESTLRPHPLLVEIEILFAPQLALDPLALLRRLARHRAPRVAAWPGPLENGRAKFSEPSRPDYYDRPVDDVLILRATERAFPDQPCFEIERWMT